MTQEQEREYLAYVTARSPWLRRVAFLLAHDWHRADDLVQTTITQLYVHWRKVRAVGNIDGYARRVLINMFLGERRSRWGLRLVLVPRAPDVPAAAVDDAARMTVRAALAHVPPRQRAALVLRYYCDLSISDTAAAMNCSTGNVKSLTSHGLAALRRLLAEPSPTTTDKR